MLIEVHGQALLALVESLLLVVSILLVLVEVKDQQRE